MASHGESTHQPADKWIPIEDRGDYDPTWRFAARIRDCVLAAVFMAWHVHIAPVNRG
jgi:hypothetical protein